jgi:hypothetical protein
MMLVKLPAQFDLPANGAARYRPGTKKGELELCKFSGVQQVARPISFFSFSGSVCLL